MVTAGKAKKAGSKPKSARKTVAKKAKEAKKKLTAQAGEVREQAWSKTVDAAARLVKLNQKTFDGTFKLLAQLQDQSEKAVRDLTGQAEWMPKEGKEVVDEWLKTVHGGRVRFQKTVDKSFSLMQDYFKRVQTEAKESGEKTAAKPAKKTAKKRPAKRKAAPRKKSAASPDA